MKQYTDYSLHLYPEIVFGADTERRVAELVKKHGGTKVMLVYGGSSAKRTGLYGTVTDKLNEAGIPFVELSGVEPNPRRSRALEGVKKGKAAGVDFIVALGGGSVIDTAKAVAYGLEYEGDFWDFYTGKATPVKMTKIGAIPTIAAAGSELSAVSVVKDDLESNRKGLLSSPFARPVFAILNPLLTRSVSPYQTAAGATDILTHALEGYFVTAHSYLADQYAEGLMRSVVKYAPIAVREPDDVEARRELMLAGSMVMTGINSVGRSGRGGGPHGFETIVSGTYDTAHGAGLGIIVPAWLTFLVEKGTEAAIARTAQFAVKVFGVEPDLENVREVALEGIRRFRAWTKSLGLPATLTELGAREEDLEYLVAHARSDKEGIFRGYIDLTRDDVRWVYQKAMK